MVLILLLVDDYSDQNRWPGSHLRHVVKRRGIPSIPPHPLVVSLIRKHRTRVISCKNLISEYFFLVTTMGLVMPWSLGLAMIDTFLVLAKRPSNQRRVLSAVVLGDWVLSVLALAVSCSTASVADFLIASGNVYCRDNICLRYQLSAAMAFLTWILSLASLLFNLWLLPTLY
ncbi:hypothetical protein KY284_013364 [Solanum tuberosum]|nr:hypothetical protein KY284_013364 [Solanum tuberosum]